MIRILKPNTIIELGSVFSIAVMLDTNEHCCNNDTRVIAIEPNAKRLHSLVKSGDNLVLHETSLQVD